MTDTVVAARPDLPVREWKRSDLRFLLNPDDARRAILSAPAFEGDPRDGIIECLRNMILIERAIYSRALVDPEFRTEAASDLDRAHTAERKWLVAFESLRAHTKGGGAS